MPLKPWARIAVAAIFASVTGLAAPMSALAEGNILRFGIDAADLGTGDPHQAAARNDRAVVDMIYNGLLRYTPGQAPSIEPDLATAVPNPQTVDGEQVWRFELRRDVTCQASPQTAAYQLTSDDVVYSLRRAADPALSAYAGEYEGMRFEKVDDFTVDVILAKPLSSILFFPKVSDYAGGLIVCQKSAEALGPHGLAANPVGTGPFQFQDRVAGGVVRLAANEAYFRGRPRLDGIEVHYLPELADRDARIRAGDLDVAFGSEAAGWVGTVGADPSVAVDVFGVGQVITLYFNMTKPPMDDRRVRQALSYAVDRDAFRAHFAKGVAENVYSPVPSAFLPGGLTEEEARKIGVDYAHDPERAKALLAEAGYPDGFTIKLVSSERDHYLANYESLREQLAAVNVTVDLEVVTHQEMHKRIREDENAIVIYVAWRPNADVFLTRFFHSDSIIITGASPDTNFSHYDQIDRLIETARAARDPVDQVRLWKQAQIKLLDDAAAYPMHYVNLVYVRRKNVNYGHDLKAAMSLYPQFTEQTHFEN